MQGINTWMLGIIGSVDRLVFSIRPNTRCVCTLSNVSGYYVDKRTSIVVTKWHVCKIVDEVNPIVS
jgi:hypothetical protein